MTAAAPIFATAAPGVMGQITTGPLAFFERIIQLSQMHVSLKFEAVKAVEQLREYLEIRQERGLEYIFAQALINSCVTSEPGGEAVYELLVEKFKTFDRRQQDLVLTTGQLPLRARENQLRNFSILHERRVEMLRTFHIARAIDTDGPWSHSPEKVEMFVILTRMLTGSKG